MLWQCLKAEMATPPLSAMVAVDGLGRFLGRFMRAFSTVTILSKRNENLTFNIK